MKLQYHKIPNIEKSICTAEQKIAYNIAFRNHISYGEQFKKLPTEIARKEAASKMIRLSLKEWKTNKNAEKYDIDSIFAALNAGLEKYLLHPFIASDYETIGKGFPANYM